MVFRKGMLTCSNGAVHDFEAPRIEDYLVERAHDTFHVAHLTAEDFHDARPRGVIGWSPARSSRRTRAMPAPSTRRTTF